VTYISGRKEGKKREGEVDRTVEEQMKVKSPGKVRDNLLCEGRKNIILF
jgi:hypothetical protein